MTPHDWLQQEALDHLAEGPMGLYELTALLNGSAYDIPPQGQLSLAREIIREVFATHSVALELLQWPTAEKVSGPLPLDVIDSDHAFEFSDDGRFVALVANEL